MKRRRFVNLVVDSFAGGRPAYTLHRIDLFGLFSRRRGCSAGAMEMEEAPLPPPAMTLHPNGPDEVGPVQFLPLTGSKDDDVVAIGLGGCAMLFGAASRAVHVLPDARRPKGRISPMAIAAGGSLYVIERSPYPVDPAGGGFEALTLGLLPGGWPGDKYGVLHGRCPGWYWRSLPPPPFAFGDGSGDGDISIDACALVGGSKLWMTVVEEADATYSFDTASGAWSKVGDWALPFHGRADHVPELGLWFGLSYAYRGGDYDRLLTVHASDLTPDGAVWRWEGLGPPSERWSTATAESYLVPLGSRKFCVARFFEIACSNHRCAVFTGVEVVRDKDAKCGLRMHLHRSKRYNFLDDVFHRRFSQVF
ncbi:hypothetical protein ACP70R_016978 [Stipagrostis hirtigluma subsp. patula]